MQQRLRSFRHATFARAGIAGALFVGATLAHAHGDGTPRGVPLPPSAADLTPPPISVLTSHRGTARGLIFVAPKTAPGAASAPVQGPEIIDELGRPVWFHAVTGGDQATDFRVQRYRGQPVLTWWQGQSHTGAGHGEGVDYILDRSYRTLSTRASHIGVVAEDEEGHRLGESALVPIAPN